MNIHPKALVLDPGNTETGWVIFDTQTHEIMDFGKDDTEKVLKNIVFYHLPVICEFPYPRHGSSERFEIFEACEVAGMYHRETQHRNLEFIKMDREDVKRHLCRGRGISRPKDKDVRKALLDKFGGEAAIAGPKCPDCKGKKGFGLGKNRTPCETCKGSGEVKPGVLYGIRSDIWAALAVAVAYSEIGPSKSAALKQTERREKKAVKKASQIAAVPTLQARLEELQKQTGSTAKKEAARQKSIRATEKRLKGLLAKHSKALGIPPSTSQNDGKSSGSSTVVQGASSAPAGTGQSADDSGSGAPAGGSDDSGLKF